MFTFQACYRFSYVNFDGGEFGRSVLGEMFHYGHALMAPSGMCAERRGVVESLVAVEADVAIAAPSEWHEGSVGEYCVYVPAQRRQVPVLLRRDADVVRFRLLL